MENNNKKGKVRSFFKRYGYFVVAAVLVVGFSLAIGISSAVSMPPDEGNTNTDNTVQTGTNTSIQFCLPADSPSVTKWFSSTELFYNQTLNQWESHKGVDMVSENLNVYAVLDGTVTSVVSDYNKGTTITITHKDGFVSVYSSLSAEITVAESDVVKAGDKIGTMSATAGDELSDGAHLHFELYKDGTKVDPANYLTLENK